jgi:hypothetical protein
MGEMEILHSLQTEGRNSPFFREIQYEFRKDIVE